MTTDYYKKQLNTLKTYFKQVFPDFKENRIDSYELLKTRMYRKQEKWLVLMKLKSDETFVYATYVLDRVNKKWFKEHFFLKYTDALDYYYACDKQSSLQMRKKERYL